MLDINQSSAASGFHIAIDSCTLASSVRDEVPQRWLGHAQVTTIIYADASKRRKRSWPLECGKGLSVMLLRFHLCRLLLRCLPILPVRILIARRVFADPAELLEHLLARDVPIPFQGRIDLRPPPHLARFVHA